jgi:hypothetical protein
VIDVAMGSMLRFFQKKLNTQIKKLFLPISQSGGGSSDMKPVSLSMEEVDFTNQRFDMLYGYIPGALSPFKFLTQPIGGYYRHFSQRLLIYLSFAAFLIISTFLAMWIAGNSYFLVQYLAFICTMALYLACVFTCSHILIDMVANQLKHLDMAYESRSVGMQWIVLYTGLTLGFCIHHVTFPKLLILCGLSSSIQLPISPWIVPLWCASIYSNFLTVQMSQKSQNQMQTEIHSQKKVLLPLGGHKSNQRTQINSTPVNQTRQATTIFRINGRQVKILLSRISHASIEDHYSRVFYQDGQRLQNILVRQSLKQLMNQLGKKKFIQIHRSYLVNKEHIIEYKRKGRNHWLQLELRNNALPVSRRRQGEVKEALSR